VSACWKGGIRWDSQADRWTALSYTEAISLANPTPTPGSALTPQPNQEESRYYVEQIKAMKDYELTTLYVDMLHLLEREEVLARAIRGQYYRSALLNLCPVNVSKSGLTHPESQLDSCPTFDELYKLLCGSMLLHIYISLLPLMLEQRTVAGLDPALTRPW
jgi:hypothetical protein